MQGIDGVLVGLVTHMVGSSIFPGKDILGYMLLDVATGSLCDWVESSVLTGATSKLGWQTCISDMEVM